MSELAVNEHGVRVLPPSSAVGGIHAEIWNVIGSGMNCNGARLADRILEYVVEEQVKKGTKW